MKKPKHIHFVGIKGVGMTPLAVIAKEANIHVSGCDIAEEFITDPILKKKGITPFVGFSKDHLKNVDFLITTGAHGGFDNPEVKYAREIGIPVWTQGQAVGEFMKGDIYKRSFKGISVTGCHGKTTTTAMVATIFKASNFDPSYVIGTSEIPTLPSPGHFGRGKYFIAEADEYATEPTYDKTPKFLWQFPEILILTNIELDHPDLYPTLESLYSAFLKFTKNLSPKGMLIANGDDRNVQKFLIEFGEKSRVKTFGFTSVNDIVIKRVHYSGPQTFFTLEMEGHGIGEFVIRVTGEHNVLNAVGAIVASMEVGIPIEKIKKGISTYSGSKRRLEYIGETESGALLYDDYAHHPTEIKRTLHALRALYPKYKIICIFEPHTYSRTKLLFDQFVNSFIDADTVIIGDIYASLREEKDPTVSSKLLVDRMQTIHKDVHFLPSYAHMVKYMKQIPLNHTFVTVTMGAGSIYTLSSELLKL